MPGLIRLALLILFLTGAAAGPAFGAPPKEAQKYERELIRTARYVWGMDAPIRVMAAQIHQESRWIATAKSPFAEGLAQFTPDTAIWISGVYPDELGQSDPYNPSWALRALARYDLWIYQRIAAATPCERWAFTLAAYNGGLGWISKDKALAKGAGADPMRWWGSVEKYTRRAAWAKKENRDYPYKILIVHQPIYMAWGPGIDCSYVRRR